MERRMNVTSSGGGRENRKMSWMSDEEAHKKNSQFLQRINDLPE
jgi:hypothetical protein